MMIALLEFGLRVTGIEKGRVIPPPIFQKSPVPDISYALKPNITEPAFRSTVRTNSLGFRSAEPNGKPVLAVLGDSITFGYGVENNETLPAQLQPLLPEWDVQNSGVPGYNMRQEAATYANTFAPLNPKAVIVMFYWNDLEDQRPAVLHANGNLYPPGYEPPASGCNPVMEGLLAWIPGKCWLDTHSAIYRVLKKIAIARIGQRNLKLSRAILASDFGSEKFTPTQVQDYIREFNAFADSLPPELPKLFVIWPEGGLHFALRPQLKQVVQAKGFKVLDLYEIFGNNPQTLSWDTVHPSAATLKRAAEVVKGALEYYQIVPKT